MLRFRIRGAIILGVLVIIVGIPTISLWFADYLPSTAWNREAEPTESNITLEWIDSDTCYYTCNCHTVCVKKRYGYTDEHCSSSCSQCPYTCYDGYIEVTYIARNKTFNTTFEVYTSYDSYDSLLSILESTYPLNSNLTLYYQYNDPKVVSLTLKDAKGYYIAFFVFISIGLVVLLIWGILELVHLIRKNDLIKRIKMGWNTRPKC